MKYIIIYSECAKYTVIISVKSIWLYFVDERTHVHILSYTATAYA